MGKNILQNSWVHEHYGYLWRKVQNNQQRRGTQIFYCPIRAHEDSLGYQGIISPCSLLSQTLYLISYLDKKAEILLLFKMQCSSNMLLLKQDRPCLCSCLVPCTQCWAHHCSWWFCSPDQGGLPVSLSEVATMTTSVGKFQWCFLFCSL